jgi:hypothetical protein
LSALSSNGTTISNISVSSLSLIVLPENDNDTDDSDDDDDDDIDDDQRTCRQVSRQGVDAVCTTATTTVAVVLHKRSGTMTVLVTTTKLRIAVDLGDGSMHTMQDDGLKFEYNGK